MKTKRLVTSDCGAVVTGEVARKLDQLIKTLPSECTFRRKGLFATTPDPTSRTDVSVITDASVDRDNEIVDPAGVILDDYRANPVVLYAHDRERPIGKALWVKESNGQLLAKSYYPARPAKHVGDWLSDTVWNLIAADVLRGKSIGFLPMEYRDPTPEERERGARIVIAKSLLLELSVVAVPCNPAALVEQITKGMDLSSVLTWNVMGKAKKKSQQKPATTDWTKFKLDPDQIAKAVSDRLQARWGV